MSRKKDEPRANYPVRLIRSGIRGKYAKPFQNDPRFLARIEKSRSSLRARRGVRLEDTWRAMMEPS
jgi:hypothetical protein